MKKQLKFKVTRKGYDIAEVDNFLNLEADKNEKIHAQQRERIVELVNEISDLKRQLKEYRDSPASECLDYACRRWRVADRSVLLGTRREFHIDA